MMRFEIIGNIGGDAEVKSDNGRAYVQFSVADTRRYTKENGQQVEQTNWVSCFYRNAEAEVVKYLKKGTRVFVRGNGEARLFSSAKDRMMKAGLSINVQEIELVGGGSNDDVPRELALHTGQLIPVYKFYAINLNQLAEKPAVMYDRKGQPYNVDEHGFVTPAFQKEQQQEQQGQSNGQESQPESEQGKPW